MTENQHPRRSLPASAFGFRHANNAVLARWIEENQDRRKQRERRVLTHETPAFAELRRGRRQIRERD